MWALLQGIKRCHSFRDYKWETGNEIGLLKRKRLPFGHLQQTLVIQAPVTHGNNHFLEHSPRFSGWPLRLRWLTGQLPARGLTNPTLSTADSNTYSKHADGSHACWLSLGRELFLAEMLAEKNWGQCNLLVCSPATWCWISISLFHTLMPWGFPDHPENRQNGEKACQSMKAV